MKKNNNFTVNRPVWFIAFIAWLVFIYLLVVNANHWFWLLILLGGPHEKDD